MRKIGYAEKENVSFVGEGSRILFESAITARNTRLSYRLSVEPRVKLRRRGDSDEPFFTVSVAAEKNGEKKKEYLRDFTSDRTRAENFYRALVRNAVFPEHLQELFDDIFA